VDKQLRWQISCQLQFFWLITERDITQTFRGVPGTGTDSLQPKSEKNNFHLILFELEQAFFCILKVTFRTLYTNRTVPETSIRTFRIVAPKQTKCHENQES
jgi:hypothetical protein